MIARPARVRMRNRNPWVLARRRLFGWNVRLPLLTAVILPVLGARLEIAGSQPSGLRRVAALPAQVALLRDDLTRSAKPDQP
jgi:ABC-type cobalamin transport system permease subunit